MLNILKEEYLRDSLNFKQAEKELIELFSKWLPDTIIDCHIHCNVAEHLGPMSRKLYSHMISTFPSFTLEESSQINALLYKNKRVHSLRFPHVFSCLDQKKANDYLLKESKKDDRIALFGLPEDIPYTIRMLSHPRVSALKMYYSYVEPTATKIYECFSPQILQEAERVGIPIILHVPKVITISKDDLLQTVADFPDLKICVPHLGSTKFVIPGLKETYQELAAKTNIHFDTSLNPSPEVVLLALETFGPDRVMFGSDAPLNLLRSVPYVHPNKGQRIITQYKYHWIDEEEYREYAHLAKDAVHAHWLCLQAIKDAIEKFPLRQQNEIKEKVFYKNAQQFYNF